MIYKIRLYTFIISTIAAFLILPSYSAASTIFVNSSASGANNGTSWTDAYVSLSDALFSASFGDEIWVAAGVYVPVDKFDFNSSGGSDAREATFKIPNGVIVYGGFNGTEASADERDPAVNITILSGDLEGNDKNLDGNFIAEDITDIKGCNAYHVVYTVNAASETIVDGFVITAGFAAIETPVDAFDPNLDGGGWFNRLEAPNNASSPTLRNNTFSGNFAESEGGAMFTNGTMGGEMLSIIENCLFYKNESGFTGGAIFTGSFSSIDYQPHIKSCNFILNEALRRGGAISMIGGYLLVDSSYFLKNKVTAIGLGFTFPGSGGAVNMTASDALFTSCIFDSNSSTGNATGPFEGGGGGAVYMSTNDVQTTTLGASEPKFISCGFFNNITGGNTAAWGGAATHLNDAGILRPEYINCVFSNNEAENDGGAVANITRVISAPDGFTPALEPAFTNCSFNNNNAGVRGGAIFYDGFEFMGSEILQSTIENSILWNDAALTAGPEIFQTADITISYSLIEGSGGSGGGWDASLGTDGGNNIDEDPLFVNEADPDGADNIYATTDDGLGLTISSPAINTGNNAASALAGITTDFAGNPRIQDTDVDMGAYERTADEEDRVTTDVDVNENLPLEYSLKQNYPNPFNPTTTIEFDMPEAGYVSVSVYNILGELAVNLISGNLNAGTHSIIFNADGFNSGVYLYKIKAGNYSFTRKMILMK